MALDPDLAEIAMLFMEESMEGLDAMESGLLNLDLGAADPEVINEIFRAAHSIKGGGATFGFAEISEFAHRVETVLDEVRQRERPVTKELVDLVLASVDCMRMMVEGLTVDADVDNSIAKNLEGQFDALLSSKPSADAPQKRQPPAQSAYDSSDDEIAGWEIDFKPGPDILELGNEPLKIFAGLDELGEMDVRAIGAEVLDLSKDNLQECCLKWQIKLFTTAGRDQVEEHFAWLSAACEVKIAPIPAAVPATEMLVIAPAGNSTAAPPALENPEPRAARPIRNSNAKMPTVAAESSSIRVKIEKVDALINLVGELVITQSMLNRYSRNFDFTQIDTLRQGLEQLERNTRDLQESIMQVRMMPINSTFSRFPRLVRDACSNLGKEVELRVSGEGTELDKTVLEKIADPLVHLVRNSLDHGLEMPDVRRAAGKPETGVLTLSAFHEGGNIIIEISDDGAGIDKEKVLSKARSRGLVGDDEELSDEQINDLIFLPGLSTADELSDLSGRGVGMDVVRRNIAELGGQVSVHSVSCEGSTITIRLPLTLAILDGQLVQVGQQDYIIPLISIVETVQAPADDLHSIVGKENLIRIRDEYIPIIRLRDVFGIASVSREFTDGLLVIVESNGQRAAICVDDLQEQQQVVIKSLERNFRQMQGISGATILGNGSVALIIDVRGLIAIHETRRGSQSAVA